MTASLLITCFIVVDQLTKYLALTLDTPVYVAPIFSLVLVWNTGVSFGLLRHTVPAYVLSIGILLIIIYLLRSLKKTTHRGLRIAHCAIIGGAVGNLMDRLIHGAVIDFLDFHLDTLHWPAFNIADALIVVGAFFLIWFGRSSSSS